MGKAKTGPLTGVERSTLLQVVQALSLPERLIVCLHHADGLSVPEIAAVLEVSPDEIARRLDRATAKVKGVLRAPKRRAA
jgi:DNA-directed RNA polymerase specialized sigma24 family protein